MKMTIFLLILSLRSAAQENHTFTPKYQIHADTLQVFTDETMNCRYEGNELHWFTDHSDKHLLKQAVIQLPFLMIYFPTHKNISTVVVHNTLLLQNGSDQFLLLPGEYRMRKNELRQFIKCKADVIAAYDSSPELSAHVCFRPW